MSRGFWIVVGVLLFLLLCAASPFVTVWLIALNN
jgi:hypothetical protein